MPIHFDNIENNQKETDDNILKYIDSPEFFKFLLSYAVFFKTAYNIHYISLMENPENFTTYYNLNCFLRLTKASEMKSIYYYNIQHILNKHSLYQFTNQNEISKDVISLIRKMHLLKHNMQIYHFNHYTTGDLKNSVRIIENANFPDDIIDHTSEKKFSDFGFDEKDVHSIIQFEKTLSELTAGDEEFLRAVFMERSSKEINVKIIKKMNAAFVAASGHTFSSFSKYLLFLIYSNYERSMKLIPLLNKSKLLNTRSKAKTNSEHHYDRFKIMTGGETVNMRRYSLLHMFEGYSDELIDKVKSELPKFFNSSVSLCGFHGYDQFKVYKKALFSLNNEEIKDFDKNKLHTYNNKFSKKGWNFLLKQSESYIIRAHNNISHGLFCAQNELKDAWLRNKTLKYFFNITHYYDRSKTLFLPVLLKEINAYKGAVVHFGKDDRYDLLYCKDYIEDKMKTRCITEAKKQLGEEYFEDFSYQANSVVKENMSYFSRLCVKEFSNFKQVQAASRKWHDRILRMRDLERERELEKFNENPCFNITENNPMIENPDFFNHEKHCFVIDNIEFHPFAKIKDIQNESKLMEHCLYRSYSKSIMENKYIAFSVFNREEKCLFKKFDCERSTLGIYMDAKEGFLLDQIQLFNNGYSRENNERYIASDKIKKSTAKLIELLNENIFSPPKRKTENNALHYEDCFNII